MLEKIIKVVTVAAVFLFPLIYIKGFAFPGIFPRAMFVFFICELLFFLFLWHSFSRSKVVFKRSYLTLTLLFYIFVFFLSAISGADFGQSFWSSFFRMSGIITWLHYFSFLFVVGSFLKQEKDWKYIFRAVLLSGFVLVLVSFLGRDGFYISPFSIIKEGGSLFGNTSYSGTYYLLVFFLSIIGFSFEHKKIWKGAYVLAFFAIFFSPDLFNFAFLKGDVAFSQVFGNPLVLLGVARASSLVLWGGLLVALMLFLFHKFTNKKNTIIAATSLIFLIAVVYIFSFTSIINHGELASSYFEGAGSARTIVWDIAKEGIKERPILGYGPENFSYVYQEHLNPKVITTEAGTEWFDNAHNFTLSHALETGIIGSVLLLSIFILIVWRSFKLYQEDSKFYFLLIPFILLFHFLQMQTFFQTDSALLLVFILLAFLVSHEKDAGLKIPSYFNTLWSKLILFAIFMASLYFFVNVPMQENLLVSQISKTEDRAKRVELQKNLCCLKAYPFEVLHLLADQFVDNTAPRAQMLFQAGVTQNIGEEYKTYLESYDKYFSRYQDNYTYLLEYSSLINTAFIFGVDELKKGEELAHKALEISQRYPHPYWILALNSYYQGRKEEAVSYAKAGLDIDPAIEQSKQIYENLKARPPFRSGSKMFLHFPI